MSEIELKLGQHKESALSKIFFKYQQDRRTDEKRARLQYEEELRRFDPTQFGYTNSCPRLQFIGDTEE